MTPHRIARVVAALALGIGLLTPSLADARAARGAELPRWSGSFDVYRSGSFSTQKTFLWCTAANVQIARNIVTGRSDQSRSSQQRYFDWMRARTRYHIPVKDGVDPQGWAAGMRAFVDSRYRLVTFRSFTAAVRSAATSLRLTNRPVGIIVANGEHAWLVTGFAATADPAATTRFEVTSVRVVGPLYGLQSRNGYDMPPDTRLSVGSLRHFFTPFDDAYVRMIWKGVYVTIQAVPSRDPGQPAHGLQPARPMDVRATPAPSPSVAPAAPAGPNASTEARDGADIDELSRPADASPVEPTAAVAPSLPVATASIALVAVVVTALLGIVRRTRP